MKNVFYFASFILITSFFACQNNHESNKNQQVTSKKIEELKFDKFNFSAQFPSKPKQSKEVAETSEGKINLTMFIAENLEHYYFVSVSEMPADVIKASTAEQMYQKGKMSALQQYQNPVVLSEKNVSTGKYKGLEFEAEGTTESVNVYMKCRLFLVDNKLYQVFAFAQKKNAVKTDLNNFLNSFKILN